MKSKTEINLLRLLFVCENMVNEKHYEEYKLKTYIFTLEGYLKELLSQNTFQLSKNDLNDYQAKIGCLKEFIKEDNFPCIFNTSRKEVETNEALHIPNQSTQKLLNLTKNHQDNILRSRLLTKALTADHDFDYNHKNGDQHALLKTNTKLQDDMTDEMAHMVQNLKSNVSLTSTIIKQDNKVLAESIGVQGKNYDKLRSINDQLEITKMSSNPWWIWFIIALVFAIFFWMLFFMKLFSKKH